MEGDDDYGDEDAEEQRRQHQENLDNEYDQEMADDNQ